MEEKICKKCQESKPFYEFHKGKNKNGLHSWCKSCSIANRMAYYSANKDKHRSYAKNRAKEIKNKFYSYLDGKQCKDCGQTNVITFEFDHLPGTIKEANISDLLRSECSWKRILNEIEKCEIVCANCHRIRTAIRSGWTRQCSI